MSEPKEGFVAGLRRRFAPGAGAKLTALGSCFVVLAVAAALHRLDHRFNDAPPALTVYCAAALREPLEAAAAHFERHSGLTVRLDYGSSGELEAKLAQEKAAGRIHGDLYLPADSFFGERARSNDLVEPPIPLVQYRIVLALKPDSRLPVDSVRTLIDQNLTFVVCNQQAGAGRRTKLALEPQGLWPAIEARKKAAFLRVPEAAQAVRTATGVQAAFLWDVTARQFELRIVRCPELESARTTVNAHVVKHSPRSGTARRFADFLAAPEQGRPHFLRRFFRPCQPVEVSSGNTVLP